MDQHLQVSNSDNSFLQAGPFLRDLMEGTVTTKVLSSRKRREKEDQIGESQPFRERTLCVQDKVRPKRESNPRPSDKESLGNTTEIIGPYKSRPKV
jgi:hypothetical protein